MMAVIELQPLCDSILEYYPTSFLVRTNLHDTLIKNILLMKYVFFTALKIPEKLSFFPWELERTDTSLLSGELYSHLLSVFMRAAEDFGSLLFLSATLDSHGPKLSARLRPRLCSPTYPPQK